MAVKTFTTGEVLTAADTNTYLNNGGMVYLAAAAFTAASPVNIDSVFSATYDVYRVFWIEADSNTAGETRIQFRTGGSTNITSNYTHQNTYFTTAATFARNTVATTSSMVTQNVGATGWVWDMIIYNPFATATTAWSYTGQVNTGSLSQSGGGAFGATTSFDGISISRTAGTMTGKYWIYGLRQP